MARLRHIINNISPDWRREADALLKSKKYHLPDDALDEVWEVFPNGGLGKQTNKKEKQCLIEFSPRKSLIKILKSYNCNLFLGKLLLN